MLVLNVPAFDVTELGDADTFEAAEHGRHQRELSAELLTEADRILETDESPRLPVRSVTVRPKLRVVLAWPAVCA